MKVVNGRATITTVNNLKYNKRQVIQEIKSFNNSAFRRYETVRDEKDNVTAQRFHFAASSFAKEGIENFFETPVVEISKHVFYIDFPYSR